MSHEPLQPAAASGPSDPVAAEADYEALNAALMQTQRGRWFLAEHARRCREADNAEMRAALARIERTLAEPREPAGFSEIKDKLGALPRIEQALADNRDPPAMAELRERLEALARIEQRLAAPQEPAGFSEIKDKLGALPRIEQTLAENRDPPAMAELRERLEALKEALGALPRIEQTLAESRDPPAMAELRDRMEALSRIEQRLAEPREPASFSEITDKLGALPRIEQALANDRDPPAMAELRDRMEALSRIEQRLAEPREPASFSEIKDKLGALPRIEQTLTEPREVSGIAALQERVAAFAATLDRMHAEMAAEKRQAEADEAERAQTRGREAEMLRLLHEQRERLDAMADIWQRRQAPSAPAAVQTPAIASSDAAAGGSSDRRSEPPPAELAGHGAPVDPVEPANEPARPIDVHTSTVDLLKQTMIFGLNMLASARSTEAVQADAPETDALLGWDVAAPGEAPGDLTLAFDPADAAVPAAVAAAEPPADQDAPVIAEPSAPAAPAGHVDPIVQMFIDAAPQADTAVGPEHANPAESSQGAPAAPLLERTGLPSWLVGNAGSGMPSGDDAGFAAEFGSAGPSPDQAQSEHTPDAGTDDRAASEAALVEAAMVLDPLAEPKEDPAAATAEMPVLAELTLDLLQKALFREATGTDAPGTGEAVAPAADPLPLNGSPLSDPPADAMPAYDLREAIATLRRAIGQEVGLSPGGAEASEPVIAEPAKPDAAPVHPSAHASVPPAWRKPEPSAPPPAPAPLARPADPLAPVYALSEEERIALFS